MCFRCSTRKVPVYIIFGLSALSIIAGIAMCILAFMLTDSDLLKKLEEDKSLGDIETARNTIFVALLIFSLSTILVSLLGFCTMYCRNKCFYCLYGWLLLPVWIIVFIFGGLCYLFATVSDETLEDECKDQLKSYAEDNAASSSTASDINISFNLYADSGLEANMCSINCPCKAIDAVKQEAWTQAAIPARGRSSASYNFSGTIETYKQCIAEATVANSSIEFFTFAKSFREQENYDSVNKWLDFFETEYDCAGICEPALFSW